MRRLIAGLVTAFVIFLIVVVPYELGESGDCETAITIWMLGCVYILMTSIVCCTLGYGVYCLYMASLDFVDWILN